jgi:hypothetical protein
MSTLLFSLRGLRRLVFATLLAVGLQTALTLAPAHALTPGWFQFDRKTNNNSNLFWMWGQYDNYNGGQIFGRVFRLSDHTCRNGSTRRTALFIHTKETPSQGQACGSNDSQCWNGFEDYYSAGCIKVSHRNYGFPDDIGNVHWQFHNNGGSRSHGSYTLQYMVYVT